MDQEDKDFVLTKRNLDREIRETQTTRSTLGMEIRELQKAKEQRLVLFGPKTTTVNDEIIAACKNQLFKQAPIGPVGNYVHLESEIDKNRPLAQLLETEIGDSTLRSYLCHCSNDQKVLSDIFDKIYGKQGKKPKIFVTQFMQTKHKVNESCHKFQ